MRGVKAFTSSISQLAHGKAVTLDSKISRLFLSNISKLNIKAFGPSKH